MGTNGTGNRAPAAPASKSGPRWIFQVDSGPDRTVLRVLDTTTDTVFREIPIEEFLDYARHNKNVTKWLVSKLPKRSG